MQDKTTIVDENYKKYVIRQAARTLFYVRKGSSPIRSVRINDKSMKEKNRESGRNVLSDVQAFRGYKIRNNEISTIFSQAEGE